MREKKSKIKVEKGKVKLWRKRVGLRVKKTVNAKDQLSSILVPEFGSETKSEIEEKHRKRKIKKLNIHAESGLAEALLSM